MQIIYVSSLTEELKMNSIIENSKKKPLQSIQKFHRLICEGIASNNIEVKTFSSIPMSRRISKKIIWIDKKQEVNGVQYNYIPFINFRIIRQITTFISTIFMTIKECLNKKKQKIFICDLLNTTISSVVLVLSKILKFKCIAIVTDLPRDIGGKFSISKRVNEALQKEYDGYIILTEAMNEIVNPKQKPYTVIEGLVDSSEFAIETYAEFYGLITGILAQNYDVTYIFVDSITKIASGSQEELEALLEKMDALCKKFEVQVAMTLSMRAEDAGDKILAFA